MIFQFDLGNSSAKWRVLDGERTVAQGSFGHDEVLPGELQSRIIPNGEFQVASVADEAVTVRLLTQLERLGAGRIVVAESQPRQLGLVNAYTYPAQMGVDRWLAMLGAWHGSRQAIMVVDAGSALTVDVVRQDGRHEGGFILPGRRLMLASLQSGTSRVLFEQADDAVPEPGQDTQSCVARGLSWLSQGLVTQIRQAADARGIEAVWLTGGDARHLLNAGLQGRYAKDLVLDGLALYCQAERPESDILR